MLGSSILGSSCLLWTRNFGVKICMGTPGREQERGLPWYIARCSSSCFYKQPSGRGLWWWRKKGLSHPFSSGSLCIRGLECQLEQFHWLDSPRKLESEMSIPSSPSNMPPVSAFYSVPWVGQSRASNNFGVATKPVQILLLTKKGVLATPSD